MIKAGKSDADLVAGLEDQLPATEINRKPPSEDTDMAFVPKIDPTEPWIKAEKPDTDLAASIHKQDAATDVKEDPSCDDIEMPLAPQARSN